MSDRVSFANIGLAYLENAILDTLGKSHYRPEHLANTLGIYPDVRINFDGSPAGNQIVRAILEALEREGRVQRSDHHPQHSWELTQKERSRRL